MKRILAAIALCFLLATQYRICNNVICFSDPTDYFKAFQFPTIADYWDKLGEWSHWEYIE